MIPVFEEFFNGPIRASLPPEMADRVRWVFSLIFGSPARLDTWLTGIADELADPKNPRVRPLPVPNLPPVFQAWMERPREVVDRLL